MPTTHKFINSSTHPFEGTSESIFSASSFSSLCPQGQIATGTIIQSEPDGAIRHFLLRTLTWHSNIWLADACCPFINCAPKPRAAVSDLVLASSLSVALDAVCMCRPSQLLPMTLHQGQSSKLISTSFYLEDASTLLWVRASVSQNYFLLLLFCFLSSWLRVNIL